jgi:transposase InsO family protein
VWALEQFSIYLLGRRFTVVTDHRALLWLTAQGKPTGKMALWAIQLQQFDFVVKHRPGAQMGAADALSRSFALVVAPIGLAEAGTMPTIQELKSGQEADADCVQRLSKLKAGDKATSASYCLDVDGLLCAVRTRYDYPVLLICIPRARPMRDMILAAAHERAGHILAATKHILTSNFTWRAMLEEADAFCKRCMACQRRKSNVGPRQLPKGKISASLPNELVGIDVLGGMHMSPEGYNYVLVIKDYLSRLVATAPMKTKSSAEVAMNFERVWIHPYGPPTRLISDQGGEFDGVEFSLLLRRYGIAHSHTAAYHPQTDGLVENTNRWLADSMSSTLVHRNMSLTAWPQVLHTATTALNMAPATTTGKPPFNLFFGRLATAVLPLQPLQLQAPQVLHAAEQHHKAVTAAAVKHVDNKKAEEATEGNYVTFKKGDLVMVYIPAVRRAAFGKLDTPWIGPCEVTMVKSRFTYMCKLLQSGITQRRTTDYHQGTHVSRMKLFKGANSTATPELQQLVPTGGSIVTKKLVTDIKKSLVYDEFGVPKPPHLQVRTASSTTPTVISPPITIDSSNIKLRRSTRLAVPLRGPTLVITHDNSPRPRWK